jgi:hypothetical protein
VATAGAQGTRSVAGGTTGVGARGGAPGERASAASGQGTTKLNTAATAKPLNPMMDTNAVQVCRVCFSSMPR